jgi:hypothetical protein
VIVVILEKQLLVLLQTTTESLKINDRCGLFTFDTATRQRVVDEVYNQQAEKLTAQKDSEGEKV